MKKKVKKLSLSRETLRNLEERKLIGAAGGYRTERTCDLSGCLECITDEYSTCPGCP